MKARVIVALIALVASVSFAGTHAAAQAPVCGTQTRVQDPGTRLPVLVVHGFTGSGDSMSPLTDELNRQVADAGLDIAVNVFDYRDQATRWVDDQAIGPDLRSCIEWLADTSLANGGPGRVAVVAHSMGGLATRFALDGDPALGAKVGLVATLGTPHQGSLLAGPPDDGSVLGGFVLDLFERDALVRILTDLDTPAARAMAVGSDQLSVLPAYPAGTPVFSGAGEFVAEQRFLFYSAETRIGDVIVSAPSATAFSAEVNGLGGVEIDECPIIIPLDFGAGGIAAQTAITLQTNPHFLECYHGNLLTNGRLVSSIIGQLAALTSMPPRGAADCADADRVAAEITASITPPVYGRLPYTQVECRDGWAGFVVAPGSKLALALRYDGAQWVEAEFLDLPGPDISEAEFRSAFGAAGVPAWLIDEFVSLGESTPPDTSPTDTSPTDASGASCSEDVLFAVAAQLRGGDPTETIDGVSYCDGQWAVMDISSDTYAYPLLLGANGTQWERRERDQATCAAAPADIRWVCTVS